MIAQHQRHADGNGDRREVRAAAVAQIEMHVARAEVFDVAVVDIVQWPAIDPQPAVDHRNRVAAHRDHALDQPGAVGGRFEHHHIAGRRFAAIDQFDIGERHAHAVGHHVHRDAIARHQRGLHRAAGHLIVIGERTARDGQQQHHHREGEPFVAPERHFCGGAVGGCGLRHVIPLRDESSGDGPAAAGPSSHGMPMTDGLSTACALRPARNRAATTAPARTSPARCAGWKGCVASSQSTLCEHRCAHERAARSACCSTSVSATWLRR